MITDRGDFVQDIPVFATENGVASLTLKEIPYKGIAYIRIQDSCEPAALLEECVSFCLAVGAERIYAAGHSYLERYPLYTAILRMQGLKENLEETDAALFPVQERTLEKWRCIYNEKMRDVPGAAYMTCFDAKRLLTERTAYFVHRGDELLGIGSVNGLQIESVATVVPGAGRETVLALCHAVFSETVILEVASQNHRAINLYRKLGFIEIAEVLKWYQVK